jgi:hypothetical protein
MGEKQERNGGWGTYFDDEEIDDAGEVGMGGIDLAISYAGLGDGTPRCLG